MLISCYTLDIMLGFISDFGNTKVNKKEVAKNCEGSDILLSVQTSKSACPFHE